MKKNTLFVLVLLFIAALAYAGTDAPTAPLKKVESKTVCMINERAMWKDQIPVEIDGKTYYGCCDMCKKALNDNVQSRFSTDPLSKKAVDKALAVIAADADGNVYYFENDTNLKKFNARFAKKK